MRLRKSSKRRYYLLRDSYACGTDYGQFDADWLLQNLFINVEQGRFYLGRKAVLQVEQYVFARYHMYRSVYFHKTPRAAEVMLQLLFRRFRLLIEGRSSKSARGRVAPGAPAAVLRAFSEVMSLDQYLELDDHTITEFLKACAGSREKTLRESERTSQEHGAYYIVRADEDASLPAVEEFRPQIDLIAAEHDAVVLELAATYDAFCELGYDHDDALKHLRRKKRSKCTPEREKAAFRLLEKLGLPT